MPKTNDTVPATTVPFVTIDDINSEHDRLVERFQGEGSDPKALCTDVFAFMRRVTATGSRLYSDSERSTAQSLLSYWSNLLYRYDVPPEQLPRNELDPFDPEAGADLRQAEFPFAEPDVLDDASPAQQRAWSRLMNEALDILQKNGLLVVIGAPGSGRSFLLRNALWPRLGNRGVVAADANPAPVPCFGIVKPGARPLHGLASALAPTAAPEDIEARVQRLRAEPASIVGQFDAGGPGALLAVDQLEELFAFASEQDTAAFLNAIAAWVQQHRHAILVCDSDTFTRLAGRDEFAARLNDAQLTVTFEATELRSLVEEPARRVGLIFDEGVLDRLLRDVQGDPAALALLQFTLQRVWKERSGHLRNRIKAETYQQLGGGWMALNRAAERVYRPSVKLSAGIKRLFTRMLSPHLGSGFTVTPVTIDSLWDENTPPEAIEHIVAEFCEAGLLRVIEPEAGQPRQVTATHPALLRHWPRAMEWLDEERVQKRGELMLRNVSEQWHTRRDHSLLWRGAMLAEARKYPGLNPVEESFLSASTRAQQMRSWIKGGAVAAIIVLLASFGYQRNERSKVERRGRLVAAREAGEKSFLLTRTTFLEGAQLITKGYMSGAALWFAESLREAESAVAKMKEHGVEPRPADAARTEAHRQRLSIALRQAPRLAHYVVQPNLAAGEVAVDAVISPGASMPATRAVTVTSTSADRPGVAQLWNPRGEAMPLVSKTGLPANAVAFRPDGWFVAVGFGATGGKTGGVQIWEAASGAPAGGIETAGAVRIVGFSPASDRVAFWVEAPDSGGGEVAVWDRLSGEIRAQTVPTRVNRIAFSPNADGLAIALGEARKNEPGEVLIWNLAAPRGDAFAPRRIPHEATVNWVEFSPDGRFLVTASGFTADGAVGEARVWRAEDGEPVTAPLRHAGRVAMASFSPDGRRVATASSDSTARVWEVRTGRALLTLPHDGWVYQARFSPDGRHLLTGSRDRCARVWDLASGRLLLSPLRHEGSVIYAAFAEGGRRVVVSGGEAVRVWDLMTAMQPPPEFERPVSAAAFSADGERIVTASEPDGNGSSTVDVVRADGAVKPRLSMRGPVKSVAFSADGQRIAVGGGPSAEAEVRVWKAENSEGIGAPLKPGGEITTLALAPPDGRRLLVVSRTADGQPRMVTLWEPDTGKNVPLEHPYAVSFVAFSPDGKLAVTGSGDSIVRKGFARVFAAATGELRGELPHKEAVTFASFDANMQRLATGGIDDAAAIWDVSTLPYRQLHRLEKVHSADLTIARFSPDGQTLLTGGYDSTAVLYDLARWERDAAAATTRLPHGGVVFDAAFNADGSRVITGSADGNARVWDARTGELIAILPHQTGVRSAGFDAAGKHALTLSFASVRPKYVNTPTSGAVSRGSRLRLQEARLWNIEPGDLAADDLRAGAELIAAAAIAGDTLGPLALEKSSQHWQRLKEPYLAQVSRLPASAYHLREATFCEGAERWFAAAWHLEAALRTVGEKPKPALLKRCGDAFTASDQWAEAEHYYDWALLNLPPGDKLWATTMDLRARMRTELHRWEDAIKDCELMQAENPKSHGPWTQLATIHLDQAVEFGRRGRAAEEAHHWEMCLKAVNEAANRAHEEPRPWQYRATLALKLHPDDPAPYLQACDDFWTRFHQNKDFAIRIAWPLVLDARADVARLRELLPGIEKAVEADPNYFRLNTLGTVYFRMGEFAKAREALDRSRKTWAEVQVREALAQIIDESASTALTELEDGRPQDQVFLAMVHQQLSREKGLSDTEREQHATEAQRWLRKALDSYDQIQQGKSREPGAPRRLWNELEFSILLKEAIRMVERPKISTLTP